LWLIPKLKVKIYITNYKYKTLKILKYNYNKHFMALCPGLPR